MINGKIQNSSLCWFDEPRTQYQHDFWLFQLSTATFASWANRVNSECWLSPSFLFYRSTYVRLGTYPQWCIDPQLSQALLLGVFLWGHSYIRFSFSLSHFLFLFCHIHIYCNLCLSVSAVSFPSQHLHFSTHFLPHSQTWSLFSYAFSETALALLFLKLHLPHFPPEAIPSCGMEGGDAGILHGTDQPELPLLEKVGPLNREFTCQVLHCASSGHVQNVTVAFQKCAAW